MKQKDLSVLSFPKIGQDTEGREEFVFGKMIQKDLTNPSTLKLQMVSFTSR